LKTLSPQQLCVVDAPLVPQSVVACAGSGKTLTAVRRLAEIRRQIGDHRGYVALLSFSNIAVNTFNLAYEALSKDMIGVSGFYRVCIETVDSFLTSNVLRPHAHRTMGCKKTPFLISGSETFLQNKEYRYWAVPASGDAFPVSPSEIGNVVVRLTNGAASFHYRRNGTLLSINNGPVVTARLAALGAYTHSLGQYWAHRTLCDQPAILRAVVRRYPYIVIDEAQDVVSVHEALLDVLVSAGVQLSLIGDPHQAIYEFAGADGTFLVGYSGRPGVRAQALSKNYRSVPTILTVANTLAKRTDVPDRTAPAGNHGPYFIGYREAELPQLLEAFRVAVVAASLRPENSAVVCRARALVNKLSGVDAPAGQGVVKGFVIAAVQRDKRQDYRAAFQCVAACVVALLADPPKGLLSQILRSARYPEIRWLAREIWVFARDPLTGLPLATLTADSVWQPALLARIKALLARIESRSELVAADNLGQKLSKKALPAAPLLAAEDLTACQGSPIKIDTVHQVKGASLDAVLYIAEKAHVQGLIAGTDTELGRIGYVALTRAKDLFWLAIPSNALKELRPKLIALGFRELVGDARSAM